MVLLWPQVMVMDMVMQVMIVMDAMVMQVMVLIAMDAMLMIAMDAMVMGVVAMAGGVIC